MGSVQFYRNFLCFLLWMDDFSSFNSWRLHLDFESLEFSAQKVPWWLFRFDFFSHFLLWERLTCLNGIDFLNDDQTIPWQVVEHLWFWGSDNWALDMLWSSREIGLAFFPVQALKCQLFSSFPVFWIDRSQSYPGRGMEAAFMGKEGTDPPFIFHYCYSLLPPYVPSESYIALNSLSWLNRTQIFFFFFFGSSFHSSFSPWISYRILIWTCLEEKVEGKMKRTRMIFCWHWW